MRVWTCHFFDLLEMSTEMLRACLFDKHTLWECQQKCSGKEDGMRRKEGFSEVRKLLLKKRSQWRHTGSCLQYCLKERYWWMSVVWIHFESIEFYSGLKTLDALTFYFFAMIRRKDLFLIGLFSVKDPYCIPYIAFRSPWQFFIEDVLW